MPQWTKYRRQYEQEIRRREEGAGTKSQWRGGRRHPIDDIVFGFPVLIALFWGFIVGILSTAATLISLTFEGGGETAYLFGIIAAIHWFIFAAALSFMRYDGDRP
jgi:hypothetical protein